MNGGRALPPSGVVGAQIAARAGREDAPQLVGQQAEARTEAAVEGGGADGEEVGAGAGDVADASRRIDAAGDDDGLVGRLPSGADEVKRAGVGGAIGEQ